MSDDDDLELDEPVMMVIDEFDTEDEAKEAAAKLVEQGVGATVDPIPASELTEDGPQAGYRVSVLDHQFRRAEEVLGLVEPVDRELANPEKPMELDETKTNWRVVISIWLAALIILPVIAFLATYLILSR